MMSGLTRPTSGNIKVFDYDIYKDINKIKSIIGISPQESAIANNLTVKENIELMASLYFKDKIKIKDNIELVINNLGLDVINRHELWNVINNLKGKVTIILTSHYMEEISVLVDDIAIMQNGKILMIDKLENILKFTNTNALEEAFIKIVGEN